MNELKNINPKKQYVNNKPDFKEKVRKELKRLKRMIGYEPDLDEVVYLLSKEIDEYREKIEWFSNRNEQYLDINTQLRDEIRGLKKENNYLYDRLKEETESNYLQSESIAPATNISIGSIYITKYPESFFRED